MLLNDCDIFCQSGLVGAFCILGLNDRQNSLLGGRALGITAEQMTCKIVMVVSLYDLLLRMCWFTQELLYKIVKCIQLFFYTVLAISYMYILMHVCAMLYA